MELLGKEFPILERKVHKEMMVPQVHKVLPDLVLKVLQVLTLL
jgi:hypothetical protein